MGGGAGRGGVSDILNLGLRALKTKESASSPLCLLYYLVDMRGSRRMTWGEVEGLGGGAFCHGRPDLDNENAGTFHYSLLQGCPKSPPGALRAVLASGPVWGVCGGGGTFRFDFSFTRSSFYTRSS